MVQPPLEWAVWACLEIKPSTIGHRRERHTPVYHYHGAFYPPAAAILSFSTREINAFICSCCDHPARPYLHPTSYRPCYRFCCNFVLQKWAALVFSSDLFHTPDAQLVKYQPLRAQRTSAISLISPLIIACLIFLWYSPSVTYHPFLPCGQNWISKNKSKYAGLIKLKRPRFENTSKQFYRPIYFFRNSRVANQKLLFNYSHFTLKSTNGWLFWSAVGPTGF